MRGIISLLALLVPLSGCALLHPYEPIPLADRAAAKLCRAHCSAESWRGARSPEEADETAGACLLSCSFALNPWYIENRVSPVDPCPVNGCGRHPAALRGCRYLGQDETDRERFWDCGLGNVCRGLPGGEIGCYRTPPGGAPVAVVNPPGCGGAQ